MTEVSASKQPLVFPIFKREQHQAGHDLLFESTQFYRAHKNTQTHKLTSQLRPVNPARQMQLYLLISSSVPPSQLCVFSATQLLSSEHRFLIRSQRVPERARENSEKETQT